jgi:hypothetical protein
MSYYREERRGSPSQVKGGRLKTSGRNLFPKGFVGSNPTPRTFSDKPHQNLVSPNVYLSNFKLVNTSPQLVARDAFH